MHTVEGKIVVVPQNIQKEIRDALLHTLSLKEEGLNLFFTDIDSMLEILSIETFVKN